MFAKRSDKTTVCLSKIDRFEGSGLCRDDAFFLRLKKAAIIGRCPSSVNSERQCRRQGGIAKSIFFKEKAGKVASPFSHPKQMPSL